jgi:hypothetical protein
VDTPFKLIFYSSTICTFGQGNPLYSFCPPDQMIEALLEQYDSRVRGNLVPTRNHANQIQ